MARALYMECSDQRRVKTGVPAPLLSCVFFFKAHFPGATTVSPERSPSSGRERFPFNMNPFYESLQVCTC